MAYDDFTLDALIQQFGLRLREQASHFAGSAAPVSARLREALDDGLPLASAIGTEKARSEFIIAPVSDWKFLRLAGDEITLDLAEYQISHAERVVGILLTMVSGAAVV